MKPFNVYRHPIQGFEAVKVGFSWPAFFVAPIWMLVKKLWGYAGLWLVALFVYLLVETVMTNPRREEIVPLGQFVLFISVTILYLVPGFKGNAWREENLAKRGYVLLGTERAETPDAAIAQYSTEHKSVALMAGTAPTKSAHSAGRVGAIAPKPISSATATIATGNSAPISLVIDENAIYAAIGKELETGSTDKGLWTRLFAECDGDENRTKVAYIKRRAETLKASEQARLDDIRLAQARRKNLRTAIMSKRHTLPRYSVDEQYEKLEAVVSGSLSQQAALFRNRVLRNEITLVEEMLTDAPDLVESWDDNGNMPLHLAVKEQHVAMTRLLLEHGAPTEPINGDGYTPMDLARKSENQELIDLISAVE